MFSVFGNGAAAAAAQPLSSRRLRRLIVLGVTGAVALGVARDSFYVVQPTELAGVRRLGTVLTAAPVGPGVHWKLPLIDHADTLQVSLDTFRLDNLTVYTIDNQSVRVSLGFSYRIPADAVFRLLYRVGGAGTIDIQSNVRPVVADRALRVFARRNTVKISEERQAIVVEMRESIREALRELFGIEVIDVQLAGLNYSPEFERSVEQAVKAKNDAVSAENTVARMRFEAEQRRVSAAGDADARVRAAEGEARAAVLRAEAEAQSARMVGQANAEVLTMTARALETNPMLVQMEAARRWSGQVPANITYLGSGGAGQAGLGFLLQGSAPVAAARQQPQQH